MVETFPVSPAGEQVSNAWVYREYFILKPQHVCTQTYCPTLWKSSAGSFSLVVCIGEADSVYLRSYLSKQEKKWFIILTPWFFSLYFPNSHTCLQEQQAAQEMSHIWKETA